MVGHFVAIAAGLLSLALFGVLENPSILQEGVALARVGAATFSVALTEGILLDSASQVASLAAGVLLVTAAGWAINHAFGIRAPLWKARE